MDAPASRGAPGHSAWQRRPARVLVIDDEPLLVDVVRMLLSQTHRVDAATSAKLALGWLLGGERSESPTPRSKRWKRHRRRANE